jgi:hypothetical protein
VKIREALVLACKKYRYPYQVDENGHIWMQGGKSKDRNIDISIEHIGIYGKKRDVR